MTLSSLYFNKSLDSKITFSVIIILAANLLAGLQMFHLGMHVKERTSVVGLIYLLTIPVAVSLNMILIHQYQLIGSGLALIATMIFVSTLYIYYSNKASEYKLASNIYAKISILLTLLFSLFFVLENGSMNFSFIVLFAFIAIYICILSIISTFRFYNEAYSKA
jgi:hypothetical protein